METNRKVWKTGHSYVITIPKNNEDGIKEGDIVQAIIIKLKSA